MPINTKFTLLHRLLTPYKDSVNNANTAYVRITTSTVWVLYVDFYVFS